MLLLFIQAQQGKAQSDTLNKKREYYKHLSVAIENGPLIKSGFSTPDSLLVECGYTAIDMRLGWRKKKMDVYTILYRFPSYGIDLYFASFHNNKMGKTIGLSYFFHVPLSYRSRKISFSYTGSFGISYFSSMYNRASNHQDEFISTPITCSVYLGVNMAYKLSDRWNIIGAIGFRHFSNGSFRIPNLGINVIPISLGLQYSFDKETYDLDKKVLTHYQNHNLLSAVLAFGSKAYTSKGPNYLKATMGVYYLRQVSYKYRIGMGMDVFYSAGIEKRSEHYSSNLSNNFSCGIAPTVEWVLSQKLYVPLAIGFYIHRNKFNDESTPYYLRGGFRYLISPHCFLGLTIKAHSYISDYFEWTAGYTFHKDPNRYD